MNSKVYLLVIISGYGKIYERGVIQMIRRWGDVFGEFERMLKEMNRLFEGDIIAQRAGFMMPAIEMEDTGDEFIIRAMVPGMNKDNVEVIVDEDRVIIKGEYKQEKRTEDSNIIYSEISYGSFERVIPLPELVKAEEAKAKFEDGVLVITLPKYRETRRGRKLDIE